MDCALLSRRQPYKHVGDKMMQSRAHEGWALGVRMAQRGLFLLPFLFLGVFYLYPLLAILRVSFAAEGGGLAALATFGDARFWRVAWFTTWQAGCLLYISPSPRAPY